MKLMNIRNVTSKTIDEVNNMHEKGFEIICNDGKAIAGIEQRKKLAKTAVSLARSQFANFGTKHLKKTTNVLLIYDYSIAFLLVQINRLLKTYYEKRMVS